MPAPKLPALPAERVVRALVACGLRVERQRGSHMILVKPGLQRPVVIARHRQEIGPKLLAQILRGADITPEEFLKHV